MLDLLRTIAERTMETFGLWGAGALMALESMIAPVPSEFVMPPLGLLVHKGQYSWWAVIIATSLGSLIGSLISYYMGYFGGKPLAMKIGKWLFINEHHLDLTTQWFNRWGSATVFFCRFVPIVRHFISIPAGMARMNLAKFCVYTAVGATLWNTFLLWLGFILGDNWQTIMVYERPVKIILMVGIVVTIVAWFYLHLRKPNPALAASAEKSETRV